MPVNYELHVGDQITVGGIYTTRLSDPRVVGHKVTRKPDQPDDHRPENVEFVNRIADYLAMLTLGARQMLSFLVSLDRPIDIFELARHNR
jgi:hypothetical protein